MSPDSVPGRSVELFEVEGSLPGLVRSGDDVCGQRGALAGAKPEPGPVKRAAGVFSAAAKRHLSLSVAATGCAGGSCWWALCPATHLLPLQLWRAA
jgi:hypothetical protein